MFLKIVLLLAQHLLLSIMIDLYIDDINLNDMDPITHYICGFCKITTNSKEAKK